MAKTMFLTSAVGRVLMWGVIGLGIYLAIRALIDGEVFIALVILLIIIPVALWAGRLIVGIASMLFLIPLSFLVRRRREFNEFMNFQLAVVDAVGTDRLNLRQGRRLLRMFEELPPPQPGAPPRSGADLLDLYDVMHPDDEDDDVAMDEPLPPRPAVS
jgi:hypothetical protein